MNCSLDIDHSHYGGGLYCKTCGMDLELNPLRIKMRGGVRLYCCKECAKAK